MNTENNEQQSKKPTLTSIPVRLKKPTWRTLQSLVSRLNRKTHGKRILADHIVSHALKNLTEDDFKLLQEDSLTGEDRLNIAYRRYCKEHGAIKKDQFLDIILSGNAPEPSNPTKTSNDQEVSS